MNQDAILETGLGRGRRLFRWAGQSTVGGHQLGAVVGEEAAFLHAFRVPGFT